MLLPRLIFIWHPASTLVCRYKSTSVLLMSSALEFFIQFWFRNENVELVCYCLENFDWVWMAQDVCFYDLVIVCGFLAHGVIIHMFCRIINNLHLDELHLACHHFVDFWVAFTMRAVITILPFKNVNLCEVIVLLICTTCMWIAVRCRNRDWCGTASGDHENINLNKISRLYLWIKFPLEWNWLQYEPLLLTPSLEIKLFHYEFLISRWSSLFIVVLVKL